MTDSERIAALEARLAAAEARIAQLGLRTTLPVLPWVPPIPPIQPCNPPTGWPWSEVTCGSIDAAAGGPLDGRNVTS